MLSLKNFVRSTVTRSLFAVAAAVVALSALQAQAALLVYEGFSYPVGGLAGQNGGSGWSNAWSDQTLDFPGSLGQVVSPGLTYLNLAVTGNHAEVAPDVGISQRTLRNLSTNFGTDGTSVYFSFLYQPHSTSPGPYNGYELYNSPTQDDGARTIQIGINGVAVAPSLFVNGALVGLPLVAQGTNVHFFVGKIVYGAGDVDTLILYADPTSLATEGGPDTTTTAGAFSNLAFELVSMTSFQDPGVNFDELRFGDTWADVVPLEGGGAVPEPSTFVLAALGLAGLGLVGWKQRRSRG
ncbi:MAG: PEP-CTERM sorting domain-containing protein [Planctomycetia bacterium]|nr:PEP-CTERM sorting domain-containing protein [Planctomycetia bacterium]